MAAIASRPPRAALRRRSEPSVRWRALAKAMLPDVFAEASCDGAMRTSTYEFFGSLRRAVFAAFDSGDAERLKNAFAFAHWAVKQPGKAVWNAAYVTFFEDIFERGHAPKIVLPWISPPVRNESMPLWESVLPQQRFATIVEDARQVLFTHQKDYETAIEEAERDLGKH